MKDSIRVAAIGDTHVTRTSQGSLRSVFAAMAERADIIVLCGDLTDTGLADEARILAREMAGAAHVPILGVLGNHDHVAGKQAEITSILTEAGAQILDGEAVEVQDIGFAGVKGFGGGFGRGMLEPWGELALLSFVREAMDEALKLESALARLRTRHRVVLLHYAPITGTVEGEPREIFPFLGSSRLEDPLNRYGATLVFHGHAHRGQLEGQTMAGVPVYNVAAPLLRRTRPGEPPFRVIERPLVET
jgi:Icc-related predicted phosphoesterase